MNSHIYEQRAENEQVGAVINCVLDQCSFDLASDGKASGASVRLHKGKQQPGNKKSKRKKKNITLLLNYFKCDSPIQTDHVRHWEVQ